MSIVSLLMGRFVSAHSHVGDLGAFVLYAVGKGRSRARYWSKAANATGSGRTLCYTTFLCICVLVVCCICLATRS